MAASRRIVQINDRAYITAAPRSHAEATLEKKKKEKKKEALTSTILCTCLLMVRGSGLGATPDAQSTTTGGLEGVAG